MCNQFTFHHQFRIDTRRTGAGHLVVVEVTCQDSHLTEKLRARQGSPLRVAQGCPIGYGRGPPKCAHGRRIIESDSTTLLITEPRCKLLHLQEWTQPFHRGYEVGGHHKTTTSITVLLAAFAATAKPTHCTSGRKSGLLFIEKSLMEKKATLNAQLFCAHIRWRSRPGKGMCSADPECTQHSSISKSVARSIKQDRTQSSFTTHSQLIVSRRLS